MRLHEFQTNRAVRWRRELNTWIMPFSVNGQAFELHMMPADRENPVTEKFARGVDVAFGRMIRDTADEPPEMHTDNTHTARNAARTVFSYVLSGIADFCSKNDPAFIEFQASRDQGKSKLYKSIYEYLARHKETYSFQAPEIEDGWGHDVFVLWHKDALVKPVTEADTPDLDPMLVLVHPGSACGSADFNLGRSQANAERAGLINDLLRWKGHILVVDGSLSEELPRYTMLNNAINTALTTAKSNKLGAGRIFADDNTEDNWSKHIPATLIANGIPKTTPISVTGAWYFPDHTAGCVNAVYDAITKSGFVRVDISDSAVIDPSGNDDDNYEDQ